MQGTILRERILEDSVFSLRGQARLPQGGRSSYLVEEDAEPRPLYMCLGNPRGTAIQSSSTTGIDRYGPELVDVYNGAFLLEVGDDDCSDSSSDEEQWAWEDAHDLISPADRRSLTQADDAMVANLYWTMRKAVGRYRIVAGNRAAQAIQGRSFKKKIRGGKHRWWWWPRPIWQCQKRVLCGRHMGISGQG